jgi:hypothetical protein
LDFVKFSFSKAIEDIKMVVILFYLCNLIRSEQIIVVSLDNNFLSKEIVMEIIKGPLIKDMKKLVTIGLFVKILMVKAILVIGFGVIRVFAVIKVMEVAIIVGVFMEEFRSKFFVIIIIIIMDNSIFVIVANIVVKVI